MIVADASALFELLDRGPKRALIRARLFTWREPICVPHLVDAEVANVLRKFVLSGRLSEARAREALQDFLGLNLMRFAHATLLERVLELRNTISAYDALYVALAESLNATLVTCDARLGRAARDLATVEVF